LTFRANNLIYESHCDFFSGRKIRCLGRINDEERNQESRPEEKGCSEEEEVVGRALKKG
jgi:hypothetical protein